MAGFSSRAQATSILYTQLQASSCTTKDTIVLRDNFMFILNLHGGCIGFILLSKLWPIPYLL